MWTQALTAVVFVSSCCMLKGEPDPVPQKAAPQESSTAPLIATDSSATIYTRAVWPLNTPLYIAIDRRKLMDDKGHEIQLQAKIEAAPWIKEYIHSANRIMRPSPDTTWQDMRYLAGTVSLPCQSVSFDFKLTNPEGADPNAPQPPKSPLSLPVKVQGTIDDVLSGIKIPELDAALQTQLNATFYCRGWNSREKPRLWVGTYTHCEGIRGTKYPGICHVLKDHPDATFAARFEVVHDSVVVASSRAWWRGTADGVHPYDGMLELEIKAQDFLKLPLKDGLWSLRIRSDPETALRDFRSARYWLGDVTVPLKVTDSNDWESLKANGEWEEQ